MLKRLFVFLMLILINHQALAHEGHGTPGSIPPALHGGKVREAKGGDGHSDLFFEAVLNGSQLTLYPLTLNEKDSSTFAALSTKQDIKNIEISVEYPRQKQTVKLSQKLGDTSIEVTLPNQKKGRFVIHASATFHGSKKTAKVQFE